MGLSTILQIKRASKLQILIALTTKHNIYIISYDFISINNRFEFVKKKKY